MPLSTHAFIATACLKCVSALFRGHVFTHATCFTLFPPLFSMSLSLRPAVLFFLRQCMQIQTLSSHDDIPDLDDDIERIPTII